jgi:hypothetical protein
LLILFKHNGIGYILPSYPSVSEYSINIGNQSIGRVPSENNLYSVETKYIPYEWLKGLLLVNEGGPQGWPSSISNSAKVVDVVHKYPHRYDIKVSTNPIVGTNSRPLIVLNQSFEKGWGLYKKNSCIFGIVSPVTCKIADAKHVLAKNWANAWIIGTVSPQAGQSLTTEYLILFWPQWLQYLGYLFLVAWVLVLAIIWLVRRV